MPAIMIVEGDLDILAHQQAVRTLIDAYARDPMGNGAALPAVVKEDLIPGLRQHPTTHIFLAYVGQAPIGIAVCFLGFSTFAARPLLNIHDLAVVSTHRGQGVGRALLGAVEDKARRLGCCKLTLEVLRRNHPARQLYEACGFGHTVSCEPAEETSFLTKPL